MSGGSFDYLYSRAEELGTWQEYQRMAASLARAGHYDAAAYTLVISTHIQSAQHLAKALAGVHRAQEWHVSGDGSREAVTAQVRALYELMMVDPQEPRQ